MTTSEGGLTTSEAMIELLSAVIPDREAVYVSAPITSGRRFLVWWVDRGRHLGRGTDDFRREHEAMVVKENRRAVQPLVRRARKTFQRPVIDPTQLPDVDGWRQSEYHVFWVGVIRRYVGTLVLAEGWAYSTGCVMEATAALEHDVDLLDADLQPLKPRQALEDVRLATRELEDASLEVDHLRKAAEAFKEHLLATHAGRTQA